ncbi:MAG TPA: hypothetical protein VI874_00165 [Candidatus Norongarragalinales archaeon]|nr:hypothetical protein [Candidatus Norongarragalinales archaeon]
MTIEGNNIVLNCRACYSESGYGIELMPRAGLYVCSHNPTHKYVVKNGFTHRA